MALWTKAKEDKKVSFSNIKPFLLPAYLILSAVFILYIAYGYINGVVYRTGLASGQQQWYEAAITQLLQQAGDKCEPVSISLWDAAVNVINVACLQTQAAPSPASQEVEPTEEG